MDKYKRIVFTTIYFMTIFTIGAFMTHNEYYSTAFTIIFWYTIPMTICFFLEMLFLKKKSDAFYVLIAVINSVILFVILTPLGLYVLGKLWSFSS